MHIFSNKFMNLSRERDAEHTLCTERMYYVVEMWFRVLST
jgi:hypothetical protein